MDNLPPGREAVLDSGGAVVFDLPRRLGSDDLTSDGTYDLPLEVPVGRLAPGPHLLIVEAKRGTAMVTRHVRFEVQ